MAQLSLVPKSRVLEFELLQTIDANKSPTTFREKTDREVVDIMIEIDSVSFKILSICYKIRNFNNSHSLNHLLAHVEPYPFILTSNLNKTESSQLHQLLYVAAKSMSI